MNRMPPSLSEIADISAKETALVVQPLTSDLCLESQRYLDSKEALESVDIDPYWPKWIGPWWHILVLHEIGASDMIPAAIVEKMTNALDTHYLKFFPFLESEIPDGADAIRHVACHCALGTMHQALTNCGVDVDSRLPFMRKWYARYQLLDGGLNCDETAYMKKPQRSSVVSTVPVMEAILTCTNREFNAEENQILDKAAQYLIDRRLFRSLRTGEIIDETWLTLCFPRFYFYDVLRGLSVLVRWANARKKVLPLSAIHEAVAHIDNQFPDGTVCVQHQSWAGTGTRWQEADGQWTRRDIAPTFRLLVAVSEIGSRSPYLTKEWNQTKAILSALIEQKLIDGTC